MVQNWVSLVVENEAVGKPGPAVCLLKEVEQCNLFVYVVGAGIHLASSKQLIKSLKAFSSSVFLHLRTSKINTSVLQFQFNCDLSENQAVSTYHFYTHGITS